MIVTELTELLKDPTIEESDRQIALQSLRELADSGNQEARAALASAETQMPGTNGRNFFDGGPLAVLARFMAKEQALYERYKAEGLTAAECADRFRKFDFQKHLPFHYSMIVSRVEFCEKESGSTLYRYHLPELYRQLKATPTYDWPARELGEAALAKYFPYEWLTRELFEEMVELDWHIKTLDFRTREQSLRSHPTIERVRQIKAKNPDAHALIPDTLNGLVYSLMHG